MGFLDAILHAAAISAIEARREVRQDEQRARDQFNRCVEVQDELNNLMSSTGCPVFYIANTQNGNAEISKMQMWMQQYREYLSLGGDPDKIVWIENIGNALFLLKQDISQKEREKFFLNQIAMQKEANEQQKRLQIINDIHKSIKEKPQSYYELKMSLENKGFSEDAVVDLLDSCNIDWTHEAQRTASIYLEDDSLIVSKKLLTAILLSNHYTENQANKAIEMCHVDWNAQALKAANLHIQKFPKSNYIFLYPDSLRKSLKEINEFSDSEVQFAIVRCNIDWATTASKAAIYLWENRNRSRSDKENSNYIAGVLRYHGFTQDQIELAISNLKKKISNDTV